MKESKFINNNDKFKRIDERLKNSYICRAVLLIDPRLWIGERERGRKYLLCLAGHESLTKPSKGGREESVHEHTTRYLHLIENLLLHESFYRNSITLREPIRVARRRKRIPIDGFLLPIFVFPSWICSRPETHSRSPLFVRYKRNTDGFNYD